jgi:hypothetical protein
VTGGAEAALVELEDDAVEQKEQRVGEKRKVDCIRQHTSAYVLHTSAYVSIRGRAEGAARWREEEGRLHTSAYVSIRQHTYSIRQHTSAYAVEQKEQRVGEKRKVYIHI